MSFGYPPWSPFTTYEGGDAVGYLGLAYVANAIVSGTAPLPANSFWSLITPTGGGGVSNPLTSNLDCGTFDVFNATTFNGTTVECDTIDPKPGSLATFIDVNQSLRVAGAGNDLESVNDVAGRVGTVTATSLNDVFDRAAGIASYNAGTKTTVFNTAPIVPGSGVEVVGDVSASSDVVASFGLNNYSLLAIGSSYNIVGGFYKTSDQSVPTGATDITWDATYAWGDALNCFTITPGSAAITCAVRGVYEIAVNMTNATGTSVSAGTNIRILSFDLTRSPNPRLNGFITSTFYNQTNTSYNQVVQGVVELLVGDVLDVRVQQSLSSGSSSVLGVSGLDQNCWMTYSLRKRLP
jgi:hypothetical protein